MEYSRDDSAITACSLESVDSPSSYTEHTAGTVDLHCEVELGPLVLLASIGIDGCALSKRYREALDFSIEFMDVILTRVVLSPLLHTLGPQPVSFHGKHQA